MRELYAPEKLYTISLDRRFFIQDAPDRLLFHINSGDYFAVVATLLGFLEESLRDSHGIPADVVRQQLDAIHSTRAELKYLRENYKIVPKQGVDKQVSAF